MSPPLKGAGRLYARKAPARSGLTMLLSVLGLTPGRSLWGLEPWDMQLFVRFFFPTFGTRDRDDVESEEEQKHVHTTNGGLSSSALTKHVSELVKHVQAQLGGGGHDDGTGENVTKPFYRVPMRRHPWGCEQYELHASWGDLFLDLAYVGAAYRLGDVVKESFYSCAGDCYDYNDGSSGGSGANGGSGGGDSSGSNGGSDEIASGYDGGCRRLASDASGEAPPCCVGWEVGMVWTVAIFATMLRLWLSDLGHRARFATTDRVHKLLDIAGYMLVLLTASNVKAYHHKELRKMDDGSTNTRFALFYVFLSTAVALWLLRYLEIAVFSHDQASRRYAASIFVDETGVLVCWTLAYLVGSRTSTPSDDAVLLRSVDVGVALLLLLGAIWPELRAYWRVKRMALFPGDWLPAQLTRVPFNVEFAIHRFAEFMMLMVGETVLQLVLAEPNATDKDVSALEAQVVHVLTLISGFAISVLMLY